MARCLSIEQQETLANIKQEPEQACDTLNESEDEPKPTRYRLKITPKRLKHEARRPMFPYPSPVEYKRRVLELNSELVVEQAKNAALGSHVDQLKNELAVAKRQAALAKNRLDIALEHIEHQKLFISDYCSVAFSSIYSEQ